jgi:hypothetical protein
MMATRRLRASLDSLSDTGPVWAHDISLVAFAALAVHRSGRATPTLRGTDKRQSMEMVGAKPSPAVETTRPPVWTGAVAAKLQLLL